MMVTEVIAATAACTAIESRESQKDRGECVKEGTAMDLLMEGCLKSLIAESSGPCVSLFFSPDRVGRSALRFGDLLHQAEERLRASGVSQAADILEPARQLAYTPAFWRNQEEGLAVFCSPEVFRFVRLPMRFDGRVLLGHRFFLAPIAQLFSADTSFTCPPMFEEGRFGQVNGSLREEEGASSTTERGKEVEVVLH
jgi:hypothetical protein